jgi:hypothetical protein
MLALLRKGIERVPEHGLSKDERARRVAEIEGKILRLERKEEATFFAASNPRFLPAAPGFSLAAWHNALKFMLFLLTPGLLRLCHSRGFSA